VLGAGRLQGLVFLTILMTVGLQGLTAQPLARMLGLIAADEDETVDATADSAAADSEAALKALPVVPDPGQ
jgi:NhaP-type Na+/H+ or K+/H+ antiporter